MAHGGPRDKLVNDVQRLKELEGRLCLAAGVNVPSLAEEWGVSIRTVQNYLEALRKLVGPTEATREEDLTFRQRFTVEAKRARLFR